MSHTEPARKTRILRGPDDGNLLWKLYKELGETRRLQFAAMLAENGYPYWRFSQDGQANIALGSLPVVRFALYAAFFGEALTAALPWPAPAPTAQAA